MAALVRLVTSVPQVLLFDIDGTLIHTGRAGVRALEHVMHDEFGVGDALEGIPLAGRTDRAIILEVLGRVAPSHEATDEWLLTFRDRYLERLSSELASDQPGKRVLLGVFELLDALDARGDGACIALLTGNFALGAQAKLRHFDLWHRFAWGAYGDAAVNRNDLLPTAMAQARAAGLADVTPADVVVIGDTPHDVACARSGGACAVAVATGPYDTAALTATGADVVLQDLGNTRAVLAALDAFTAQR